MVSWMEADQSVMGNAFIDDVVNATFQKLVVLAVSHPKR
jgi:hypothetical protein